MWFRRIANIPKEDLLFHGTSEPIEGPISPQSHGGILWVAETPDIAQNYIPESGISSLVHVPSYRANDPFPPNQGFNYNILTQMGYQIDAKWDRTGWVESWSIKNLKGNSLPKYRDVRNYIMNVLGYKPYQGQDLFRIKTVTHGNGKETYMPAVFKSAGTLFILTGKSKLNILDLTGGSDEDDLMDPTYNRFDLFKKAKEMGYDGVRINDFAQSRNHGNLGHKSIGLFQSGLDKLQVEQTTATNFDWEDSVSPVDTDEFKQWYESRNKQSNWTIRFLKKYAFPIINDPEGNPQVFYHGTDNVFDQFEKRPGKRGVLFHVYDVEVPGHFFSEKEENAKQYGDRILKRNLSVDRLLLDPNVYPHLGVNDLPPELEKDLRYILEPLITETGGFELGPFSYRVREDGSWIYNAVKSNGLDWSALDEPRVVERMKELGYDGTYVDEGDNQRSIFVVDSKQIYPVKS